MFLFFFILFNSFQKPNKLTAPQCTRVQCITQSTDTVTVNFLKLLVAIGLSLMKHKQYFVNKFTYITHLTKTVIPDHICNW